MWEYPTQQASATWRALDTSSPSSFPVGLLGFGKMATAVARVLTELGYPVTAFAKHARQADGIQVLTGQDGLDRVVLYRQA